MTSGLCVRVLLLSLLAFSKHAESLTYRSTYSSGIKPYSGMAENFPHNQNPVFRHKSYAQPRSSLGVYGPEHGSPENSYPTAAGMPGGAGASSGRPLNGYHQQGSVSSYRSGSSHYQGDTDGALQSKDAMWGLASPQKRNRIDTGIVSSYPIEMRSVPQWPSNEHQTQPHPEREQFSDFQSRPLPQQPRYEASKPQAQARPLPQQPRYEASKPQAQARPLPQQPRYEASKPQARPLPQPLPQQPHYEARKPHAQPHLEREQFSDETSNFQPRPLPQQPRYEASKPQAQARPFPQQPRYEARKPHAQPHLERKQFSDESSQFQSQPQPRPLPQQPRYEASKPQAHPRSEANSPSEGVLQNKASMWDLAINSNADPRSLRPIQVSSSYIYSWPQQQAPFYNRY
ncbi:KRAB domain-containing zinc finger protein [Sarotherodon galilaeus]